MSKTVIPNGGPNDRAVLQGFYLDVGVVGNLIYVSSVTGTSSGPGWTPENAYATLQQAHDAATASNGDVIVILPGHVESVVAAGTIALTKAGLTIIGKGVGRNRPIITFSTLTSAQMTLAGANTTLRNIVFNCAGLDAIVACIKPTAADVAFEDCEFIMQTSAISPALGILTAATATRLRVERCRFLGVKTTSGGTLAACIKHEVGEDFLIKDCYFEAKCTQAILNATAIIAGLIDTCKFHIYTGTISITLHASTQATINNCSHVVASGTAPIVGTIANVVKNSYTTEGIGVNAGTAGTF